MSNISRMSRMSRFRSSAEDAEELEPEPLTPHVSDVQLCEVQSF